MPMLARSILAATCFIGALACSSRQPGAQDDIPARPPLGAPVDRLGRPLTGNALIGPLAPDGVSDRRKEAYNRASPSEWSRFAADFQPTLGLYDGFDRKCGNQWAADRDAEPAMRYRVLARTLADDRLWIDSRATTCRQYLAVELAGVAELAELEGQSGVARSPAADCGGRTPGHDVVDVFRSLLILGEVDGVDDGVERDDHVHSATEFPFLAAP